MGQNELHEYNYNSAFLKVQLKSNFLREIKWCNEMKRFALGKDSVPALWKFHDFSATQIIRGINFGKF